MMNETEKPFACSVKGCEMTFTNEDHLNWHQKKHDMMLNLGLTKNNEVADQTPTPTRFIRNCEEVGLFQDLQNVNPFDEIFQKAVDQVKTGVTLEVPDANSDETLHTPHILPHIEESKEKSASTKITTQDNNSHSNDFILNGVISINPEANSINSVSNSLPITTKEFVSNNVKRKIKEALEKKEKRRNKSDIKKEFISVIPLYDLTEKKETEINISDSEKHLDNSVIKESRQKIREMNRAAQMRCRKRKQLRWMEMEEELQLLREHNKKLRLENYNLRIQLKELQDKGQNVINNDHSRNRLQSPPEEVHDTSSTNPIFIQVLPRISGIAMPVIPIPTTSNVDLEESMAMAHKKVKKKKLRKLVPKIIIEN